MSWQAEVDELNHRKALAAQMGGEERVKRQRDAGKLNIRQRIEAIVDHRADPAGGPARTTFSEIGATSGVGTYDEAGKLVSFMPANLVIGIADIDGRPVMLSGDDFTVRGGSAEATIPAKRDMAERLALELRLPHVRLVDGMGGGGSVKSIEIKGRTLIPQIAGWEHVVGHLAVAPSVALALGSVAGIGAARVATSHYSVIVSETAQMMIAGPALVEQAGQPEVSKEDLGHARVHTTNGAIDDAVPTEAEAFARTKRFLSYLPRNIDELPPRGEPTDDPDRRDESLLSVVPRNPRRVYKMRDIIASVFDREPERDPDATDDGAISGSSFFEIGRDWGRSVICGLARLDGWPVAVIAEDPYVYGGAWTADASAKVIRHLDMASTFHLPVVHLEDCPGFLIGKQSEDQATIRIGSRALAALGQCTSPFCCIVIRKAFGVAGASNRKPGSLHPRWSWPSGDWGSLPIEGGIEVAYRTELAGLEGEAFDAELAAIKERLNQYRSPFRASEVFEIDDVIDPRDSRPTLCRWANLVAPARTTGPSSFTYRP